MDHGDVLVREPKPDEEAVGVHSLAIDHFAEHRSLPFHRGDLCMLAHSPYAGGLHANSMRADVVRKRSLAPLPPREPPGARFTAIMMGSLLSSLPRRQPFEPISHTPYKTTLSFDLRYRAGGR